MATFPDLLRSSFARCNRAGKAIGIAVAVTGCASVALWFLAMHTVMSRGLPALEPLIGSGAAVQIRESVWSVRSDQDVMQIAATVSQRLEERMSNPTEHQDEEMRVALTHFAGSVAPFLALLGILGACLWLWSRAYFLLIGVGAPADAGQLSTKAVRLMLPLLGVNASVGIICCVGFFVPFLLALLWPPMITLMILGFIPLLLLLPRLALAPAVLAAERCGVLESLRRSYRITQGQWLRVLGNLLGVSAVAWIGVVLAQFFLNLLIRVALPFSPAALLLGQFMTFVALLAAAYRSVFHVQLTAAVKASSGTRSRR